MTRNNKITLYVSKFSDWPTFRERGMGPKSAEEYFEDIIMPILTRDDPYLEIIFDNKWPAGPSFVLEITKRLIEHYNNDKSLVRKRVSIKSPGDAMPEYKFNKILSE